MGLVKYIGPYTRVTVPAGNTSVAKGESVELSNELCAALLTDPADWEAGDEATRNLVAHITASVQSILGYSAADYDAETLYPKGIIVKQGVSLYLSLKVTQGESPESHPATWQPLAALPASVVISSLKTLGEVEGNVTPNLAEGRVFVLTAKGNVTIHKPTKWPSGVTYVEPVVIQDAAGGHSVTFEGVTWLGGAPVLLTAPNAVNAIQLVSYDGGLTCYGIGPQKGEVGPVGPEAVGGSPRLLLPSAVATYPVTSANTPEGKPTVAETYSRNLINATLALTSGTPILAALVVPAKKVISGVGFAVTALEGTPANRTHLWVALLNSSFEVLKRGLDYASSANTPLAVNTLRALALESSYETPAQEVLYALLCETMSSTAAIAIGVKVDTQAFASETEPKLFALGNAGQTTPAGLPAKVTPVATPQAPYMVLV